MYKFHRYVLFACLLPQLGYTQIITWQNPAPSSLAPFNQDAKLLSSITDDTILLYSHPHQTIKFNTKKGIKSYQNVQFTSAALVVDASSQEIHNTLKNYEKFIGLFPTLKKTKVLETKGNIQQVHYKISIPTPIKVLNFNEDTTIQHEITSNKLSSQFIDGPVQFGISTIEWFPLDQNRSLVTITQWSDMNSTKGFLINTLLKAMPEIKTAMPYGVNTFVLESLRLKFNGKTKTQTLSAGKLPEPKLSSAQYDHVIKLSQKTAQPVSFVHPTSAVPYKHGAEDLRFTTSIQYFKVPTKESSQLLQPTIYQKLFPKHIRKIDLIPNTDTSNDAIFHIRAGLGVITIPFTLRLRFNPHSTTTDMIAVGGDLKFIRSRMQIEPYQQHSVWKMTTASKIDESAPFLLRSMRSLPYHEILPSASLATVITEKAVQELKF